MSIVKQVWAEHELIERDTWRKPLAPLAMRIKKAEKNLIKRLKKC